MKKPTPKDVEKKVNPVGAKPGGPGPRGSRGQRIPGRLRLDHFSMMRFSQVLLLIVFLAGGTPVMASLLPTAELVGPGTAEIIRWVGVGAAFLIFLWDGVRRFRRSREQRKQRAGEPEGEPGR